MLRSRAVAGSFNDLRSGATLPALFPSKHRGQGSSSTNKDMGKLKEIFPTQLQVKPQAPNRVPYIDGLLRTYWEPLKQRAGPAQEGIEEAAVTEGMVPVPESVLSLEPTKYPTSKFSRPRTERTN